MSGGLVTHGEPEDGKAADVEAVRFVGRSDFHYRGSKVYTAGEALLVRAAFFGAVLLLVVFGSASLWVPDLPRSSGLVLAGLMLVFGAVAAVIVVRWLRYWLLAGRPFPEGGDSWRLIFVGMPEELLQHGELVDQPFEPQVFRAPAMSGHPRHPILTFLAFAAVAGLVVSAIDIRLLGEWHSLPAVMTAFALAEFLRIAVCRRI